MRKNKATTKDLKASENKSAYQNEATYSAFNWRSIGPAVTSGRIGDIAVNPKISLNIMLLPQAAEFGKQKTMA